MKNYNIVLIVAGILLGGAALGFVITGFATAGEVAYDHIINYDPISPDPVEPLNIYTDVGKVLVKYNTTATTHYADIEVNIRVAGLFMAGKVYTDFYSASSEWWDESTNSFALTALPGFWFDPSHWFSSYNINISITLRTDVVYDLDVSSSTGKIEMYIPENIVLNQTSLHTSTGALYLESSNNTLFNGQLSMTTSTGETNLYARGTEFTEGVYAETSTGGLVLNFTDCIVGDNLIGHVTTGKITYNSYNMIYSQNIDLNLETSTGEISANIYHYISMNANVTSSILTSTGNINILYRDSLAQIGASFTSSTSTGTITYTPDSTMEIISNVYRSINYPIATQRYSFTVTASTGNIAVNGQSAHP